MKVLETTYDRPAPTRESAPPRIRFGATILFLGLTAFTVMATTTLGQLKYGVVNVLGVVFVLLVLMMMVVAFPQVKANVRYLWPRLNCWHLIWYGVYISALVWERRTYQQVHDSLLDGWSLLRLGPEFLTGLYFLYLLGTGRVKWLSSLFKGIPGVLAVYCVFSALTTFWSVFAPWTLFKSLEYMLDVSVMAAILCVVKTSEDYKTLLDWTWTIFSIELIWCCLQVGIWPSECWDEGRLAGVFPLTGFNAVGAYAALIATVAMCRLVPVTQGVFERSWYGVLFLWATALTVMSQTRNALGGLVIAVVVVLIMSGRAKGIVLLAMSGGLVLFTALGAVVSQYLQRGQSSEAIESLTGRMVWWHYAWLIFLEHPWGGVGAYAGGRFAVLKSLGASTTSSVHSDYVEILVGTGIPGIVLFSIAVLWTLYSLWGLWRDQSLTPQERQVSMECFAVMLVLFVHSFFNVELAWHAPQFFLVCLGWAELMRRRRKQQQEDLWRASTRFSARPTTTSIVLSPN